MSKKKNKNKVAEEKNTQNATNAPVDAATAPEINNAAGAENTGSDSEKSKLGDSETKTSTENTSDAAAGSDGTVATEKTIDHTVTNSDLKANPELEKDHGIKAGDKVELPVTDKPAITDDLGVKNPVTTPETKKPFERKEKHMLSAEDIAKYPEFTRDGFKEGDIVQPGPDENGDFKFKVRMTESEIEEAKKTPTAKVEKKIPAHLTVLADSIEKMFEQRATTSLPQPTHAQVIEFAGPQAQGIDVQSIFEDDEKTKGYVTIEEFGFKLRIPKDETQFLTFGKDYSTGA